MAGRDTITQRITLDGGKQVELQLRDLGVVGENAAQQIGVAFTGVSKAGSDIDKTFRSAKSGVDGVRNSVSGLGFALRNMAGLLIGGLGIRAIANATSQWSDLTGRVRLAIGEHEEVAPVMERLSEVARRTFTSVEATTESWLRNSTVLKELRLTTEEQLDFQEALNNTLVVSGARGERVVQVQNAINKAMATGSLRGEELQTVLTFNNRFAQALAETLNTTVSSLRALAAEGAITPDVIRRALDNNFDELRAEADSMAITINDAILRIQDAFFVYIGQADQASGASKLIASGLKLISDNMDVVVPAIALFAAAWAAVKFASIVGGLVSIAATFVTVVIPAIASFGIALLANPITLWVAGITAAAVAVLYFTGQLGPFIDALKSTTAEMVSGLVPGAAEAAAALQGMGAQATSALEGVSETAGQVSQQTTQQMIEAAANSQPPFDSATQKISGSFNAMGNRIDAVFDRMVKRAKAAAAEIAAAMAAATGGQAGFSEGGAVGAAFAGGGHVRGPGSSKSDSILAWLSNGEYVIRAAAVRKYGKGLLDAINGLRAPGFNLGGLIDVGGLSVPRLPAFAEGGGVSGVPFNLNIGGEQFNNLLAPSDVADRLAVFASSREIRRTGRMPSWFGGGR